ncbi:unnamed protein product [Mytilus coruscus]|uniref:C-type lectin domain-containing protein n=1 Tax=Mytilus coruscus TaxID=42192 RepID=A0A6J8BPN7_MYTCO|nr:unnamed protein product [Mytilus coruscus]
MKYMRFALFCILFRVCFMINNDTTDVHVKYIPQRKTWSEAEKSCQDEGGRLATDKDSILTCDKLEGDINSDNGSTFWSGKYTTMTAWISREGCYNISNITDMPHSLSECFEVCRHKTTIFQSFAYRPRDQKCVCLHGNILMQSHESHNCSDFLKSNTTYLLYRVINSNSFNSTGNCAFVDCSNGHRMEASTCNDKRRPFCGIYSNPVVSPDDVDWMISQEKCKDTIPIKTYNNICAVISHDERKGIWLPIEKIALRTEISDDGIDHGQGVTQCTSYHCNKGKEDTIANTACKNKTDGFFCLLHNGTKTTNVNKKQQTTTHVTSKQQTTINLILKHTVTKESTEYVKQTATSNTGTDLKHSGNTLITTTNITTKPRRTTDVKMVKSVPSNSTDYWKDTPTSDTGLVVGGAVGTVLLIFAIVLIVVIKIRCKNATSKNENGNFFELRNGKSPVYEDQHRKTGSSNDKMFNKKLYDEQCLTPCKIVPDESIRNEINNREDCKRHNYDYAVPIETKRTQSSPKQEDFKDGIDVESEYDILNKTPRSLNNTLEHNIYDTTIASRCESDPTYNTSTSILSNQKNVDDMYDRL